MIEGIDHVLDFVVRPDYDFLVKIANGHSIGEGDGLIKAAANADSDPEGCAHANRQRNQGGSDQQQAGVLELVGGAVFGLSQEMFL